MSDTNSSDVTIAKIFFLIMFGILSGMIMFYQASGLLSKFAEIRESEFNGVLSTIYGLISAFILVNAWNHYNKTNSSISNENEALIAIWNGVEYLEDPGISKQMRKKLLEYLDQVMSIEMESIKKN